MSQTELSYEELKQGMKDELQQHRTGVLATSDDKYVTARGMLLFYDGLTIYCNTSLNSRKYKQITANNNAAVAIGNLQIEGVAKLRGHPFDEENARYIELYKEQNPAAYERAASVHFKHPASRVIEITPKRIAKWTRDS